MTQAIQKKLNDSAWARWTALILVALTMFFGYMFVDVLSPLQNMLESTRGWSPTIFGLYGGSEFILNVCGFLLVAGIILDKMGVRFTGILSASLMVLGAGIKFYGLSNYFYEGGFGYEFLNSFLTDIPASAKLACLGFMIFGCGTEMAGVTVSRAIVKWFTGKELALAMGLEMAIARLGVFAVFSLSPWVANWGGDPSVARPVAVVGLLLCIGLLTYIAFSVMDFKLDRQTEADTPIGETEEPFKVADLKNLFSSKTFLIVSALCVLIARRSAMPRYISILYALPYLAVKSYKVMRRRISIAAAIISAVVLCAAQCAYIMDNNILNSGNAALIEIVLTYLSVNVHISCLSAYKISACGVPQALFAAMSLLFLSFLCSVFLYVACGAVPVQFVCVRQFVRILRQKLPHLFPYLFYGQPA